MSSGGSKVAYMDRDAGGASGALAKRPRPATLGPPRSEMEAIQFLHGDVGAAKFRQLPCRTFISVGSCPYRERCVYLHDPRLLCPEAKSKSRKKNKEEAALDAYFWPCLKLETVSQCLDSNRQPTATQEYSVPPPQDDVYKRHDSATYSMWMHFCDLCASSQGNSKGKRDYRESLDGNVSLNLYSKGQRLSVFRSLSSREEFGAISPGPAVSYQPVVLLPTPMPTVQPASIIQNDRSFLSAALHKTTIPGISASVTSMSTPSSKINFSSSPGLKPNASRLVSPRIVPQQSFESPAPSTYNQAQPSGRINAGAQRPSYNSGLGELPAELSFLQSPVHLAKTRSPPLFFENQCDAAPKRFESFGSDLFLLSPSASPRTELSLHTTSEEVTTVSDTFSISTASTETCSTMNGPFAGSSSFNPNAQSFVPGSVSNLASSCISTSVPINSFLERSGTSALAVEMDVLSDLVEGLSCSVADFDSDSQGYLSGNKSWLDTGLWDSGSTSSQSNSFFPTGWTIGNQLECRPCPHTERELNSLLMHSTLCDSTPSSAAYSRLRSPNTVAFDFFCESSRATSPVHMAPSKHPSFCSVFPPIPSSPDEYAINTSAYDSPSHFHYPDSSLFDSRVGGDLRGRSDWSSVKSDEFQSIGNHDLYTNLLDDDEGQHLWPCGV